jgi:prevent-host-death family protein
MKWYIMQKIIGTTDLQRNFRTVFDEVAKDHIPYVLTRGSRPEAALVPYADYLRFQQLQERDVLRRVDALLARLAEQDTGYDAAEVADDVTAAIEEARSGDVS